MKSGLRSIVFCRGQRQRAYSWRILCETQHVFSVRFATERQGATPSTSARTSCGRGARGMGATSTNADHKSLSLGAECAAWMWLAGLGQQAPSFHPWGKAVCAVYLAVAWARGSRASIYLAYSELVAALVGVFPCRFNLRCAQALGIEVAHHDGHSESSSRLPSIRFVT